MRAMSLALAAKNGLSATCCQPSKGIARSPICRHVAGERRSAVLAQPLARDRRRADGRCREARRRAAAAARVAQAVLVVVGVVGVAGTERVEQVRVVLAALIGVADQERDRRPGRSALEDAGEDLDLVLLLALGDVARGARPAPVELGLDVGLGELHAGRTAIDDAADRRAVALAERRDAKQRAERASRHLSARRAVAKGANRFPGRQRLR